jgi:S1-C subfamily serine protease
MHKAPSWLLLFLFAIPVFAAKDPSSIDVNINSISYVKDAIASAVLQTDPQYKILSDTTYQLVLGKEMTGFSGAMTQVLMGNSYSNTPVQTATFIFVKTQTGVRVTMREEVVVDLPMGRENRQPMDNKKVREGQANFLKAMKLSLEAQPKVPPLSYLGIFFQAQTMVVHKVGTGTPAEAAGLKSGDMMVSVAGVPTTTQDAFDIERNKYKPGDKVKFTVLRDGKLVEMEATLATPPQA